VVHEGERAGERLTGARARAVRLCVRVCVCVCVCVSVCMCVCMCECVYLFVLPQLPHHTLPSTAASHSLPRTPSTQQLSSRWGATMSSASQAAIQTSRWVCGAKSGMPRCNTARSLAPLLLQSALGWYEIASDAGLPDAQRRLGAALFAGEGVAQDTARGVELLHRAVQGGDAPALDRLEVAAQAGDADAALALGQCILDGAGGLVESDPVVAVQWVRHAFDCGPGGCLRAAALQLADCYRRGLGVDVDAAQAAAWEERARGLGS
jgi:TPR repeat protein